MKPTLFQPGCCASLYHSLLLRGQQIIERKLQTFQPLPPSNLTPDPERALLLQLFDENFYRNQFPDKLAGVSDPLDHYLSLGWRMGKNPHPTFDTTWYLQSNPDVARDGQCPLNHYLKFGQYENRSPVSFDFVLRLSGPDSLHQRENLELLKKMFPPELEEKIARLDSRRKTVLLVTHETSRTGAPLIALNVLEQLHESHQVVCFSMLPGPWDTFFSKACDLFWVVPSQSKLNPNFLVLLLLRLLKQVSLDHAIVNSIESKAFVPVLASLNVPCLFCLHEFPSSFRDSPQVGEALRLADTLIFPTHSVQQAAQEVHPEIKNSRIHILPQGLCRNPESGQVSYEDQQKIARLIRPPGWEDSLVILGVGSVIYRKGVDLFLSAAAALIQQNPERRVRFVWVGSGFRPDVDRNYSNFIAEQISRSRLGSAFAFIGEVFHMEAVYTAADLFFLSSRSDPFPLVAQEALSHGLPVVCFDQATGLVDFLAKEDLLRGGIVPYLHVHQAVGRLQTLIDQPGLRKEMGDRARDYALRHFGLSEYTGRIARIAKETVAIHQRDRADRELIQEAGVMDLDSWGLSDRIPPELIREYVRSWAVGLRGRKPFPGFHPGIYREQHPALARDPLADYLASGRPAGSWKRPVLDLPSGPVLIEKSLRAALHLHVHYPDLLPEIFEAFRKNTFRPDLFITVTDAGGVAAARACAEQSGCPVMEVIPVPNRGRDIGPLITVVGFSRLKAYDFIGHIHTKKTEWIGDPTIGEKWRRYLLENTIGGKYPMMDCILQQMQAEPDLGLVFPDDPHVQGWSDCRAHVEPLLSQLGWQKDLPEHFDFPIGSYYWARTAALERYLNLGLEWKDYPAEPLANDGTLLHALERLVPFAVEAQGYRLALTRIPGVRR